MSPNKRHSNIVRCAIYPAIGIARLGDCPDEYFIGAEVPGSATEPPGGIKHTCGRMKRQAARFRLYGLDEEGRAVKQITADEAEIVWTVHVANHKAAWYQFDLAFDLPEAQFPLALRSRRRNANIAGACRAELVIDPGSHSIMPGSTTRVPLDTGSFMGMQVPLGELRTDDLGNLLVLGGVGSSGTPLLNNPLRELANNDAWYDDVSDGPVSATVTLLGRRLPVVSAWVVVAPPNYAPGLTGVVTLFDVLLQAHVANSPRSAPADVSFVEHIYPIFARLSQLQWVNRGCQLDMGWGAAGDLLAPETLQRLASAGAGERFLRDAVFRRFRDPRYLAIDETALPPIYGDAMDLPLASPRQFMAVTPLQYEWLGRWSRGDFVADLPSDGLPPPPPSLDHLPVIDQPAAINRCALEDCLGGPFRPGWEVGWPMRMPLLYDGFARLRVRGVGAIEPDYGDVLTPSAALAPDGPLRASGPGQVTRWLGVPWQSDAGGCRFAYRLRASPPLANPYLPSFWPARVPNQVLVEAAYRRIMDADSSAQQRHAAFDDREDWLGDLDAEPRDPRRIANAFVSNWSRFSVVVPRHGPRDVPGLPGQMHVAVD